MTVPVFGPRLDGLRWSPTTSRLLDSPTTMTRETPVTHAPTDAPPDVMPAGPAADEARVNLVLRLLTVAAFVVGTASVFLYLPVLLVSGILTGLFTGLCAQYLYRHLKKLNLV